MSSPREMSEIQAEFQRLCAQLGHVKYQIDVFQAESTRLSAKIGELNVEASNRTKLDQEAKETAASTTTEAESNG